MRTDFARRLMLSLVMLALLALAAGCGGGRDGEDDETSSAGDTSAATGGGGGLSGTIQIDGSSTVGPYVTAAYESFKAENPDVQAPIGISGTGGGFERFCAGETDISNASRAIKDEEAQICTSGGVEYYEIHIANDGIAVVVNPENDWATCLTTEQLSTLWKPDGAATSWSEVDASFPDEEVTAFGPGTDSGTFDFFTDVINGEEGASRTDYQATEDDNVIVEGVGAEKGGTGYFGLSYAEQNTDKVNLVQVDGGSGCVTPTSETVQSGEYTPLSRPLYIYVKKSSMERPEVAGFVTYIVDNETAIAEQSLFVPLTDEQLTEAKSTVAEATGA